jgi:hypothetical protein
MFSQRLPNGDPIPILLGPYEDSVRRYLIGETGFPKDAVVLVSVSASADELKNKFVTFPWLFKRAGEHHQFKLIVPGVTYQILVGKIIAPALRRMCSGTSPAGYVYMSEDTDKITMEANAAMPKNSRRVGKLAEAGGVLTTNGKVTM